MANNKTNSHPDWLQAIMREAAIRKVLIIDGTVQDIFYDDQEREYVALPELLRRLFTRETNLGFTLAGKWDQADGLRFKDDKTLKRFQKALGGSTANVGGSQGGSAYDMGGGPQQASAASGLYTDPTDLLAATRKILQDENERPVFILDDTQYMVTQAATPDPAERQWMLQMKKAITGNDVVSFNSDNLKQNKGLLIFLTTNLGKIPPLLYQSDPRIKQITIASPSRPQRRDFFLRHIDDLRCQRPKSGLHADSAVSLSREDMADHMADLTDELKTYDLKQLLAQSLNTEAPLRPDKLLNLYKLGDQSSPWEELSRDKLKRIEETLKQRVIGQDPAVHHVATMAIRAYMGLSGLQHNGRQTKPKGSLFFVGPTGVGKTELAKALAEFVFGDESAFIRFDMSEYNHEHSDQKLIGAPPGYVGFEDGGQLTNAVREKPFSVILFDEIEKAHGRILDKFLQILEDGRLTDGRGETVHFSESVIIFTSNIGASSMPATDDSTEIKNHFERSVEDHFINKLSRPELLNRLGENVVVFDKITDDTVRTAILKKTLKPLIGNINERFGVQLQLTPEIGNSFLESANNGHGGRGLVNVVEDRLVNPLSWFLFEREHQLRAGRTINVTMQGDDINFELQENSNE